MKDGGNDFSKNRLVLNEKRKYWLTTSKLLQSLNLHIELEEEIKVAGRIFVLLIYPDCQWR